MGCASVKVQPSEQAFRQNMAAIHLRFARYVPLRPPAGWLPLGSQFRRLPATQAKRRNMAAILYPTRR